jgi:hypothetical protein
VRKRGRATEADRVEMASAAALEAARKVGRIIVYMVWGITR